MIKTLMACLYLWFCFTNVVYSPQITTYGEEDTWLQYARPRSQTSKLHTTAEASLEGTAVACKLSRAG